jgi:hypothetical protein
VTSDVLESLALADRQQAVRRALAEALQLTRLQVGVLVRLEEADEAGDVAAVLRYHAELDDLMTRLTTVDRVRTGVRAELPDETDLSCSACGAVTEPLYETPRLLGYTCGACGWTGDDPAVQAERRDEEAKDFAAKTVQRSVPALRDAMETLNHRGKKERQQGTAALALPPARTNRRGTTAGPGDRGCPRSGPPRRSIARSRRRAVRRLPGWSRRAR